jgi:hypothetical protein
MKIKGSSHDNKKTNSEEKQKKIKGVHGRTHLIRPRKKESRPVRPGFEGARRRRWQLPFPPPLALCGHTATGLCCSRRTQPPQIHNRISLPSLLHISGCTRAFLRFVGSCAIIVCAREGERVCETGKRKKTC